MYVCIYVYMYICMYIHSADDKCLQIFKTQFLKSMKDLKDLRKLSFWLNANKIAINVGKTEVILFKTKQRPCDTDLKLKLCRNRLNEAKYV